MEDVVETTMGQVEPVRKPSTLVNRTVAVL